MQLGNTLNIGKDLPGLAHCIVQPDAYLGLRSPDHTGPPLHETSLGPPSHLAKWPARASAGSATHPTAQSPSDSAAFADHAHVHHQPFHVPYPLHDPLTEGEILFFLLFALPSWALLCCFHASTPLCSSSPNATSEHHPEEAGVSVFVHLRVTVDRCPHLHLSQRSYASKVVRRVAAVAAAGTSKLTTPSRPPSTPQLPPRGTQRSTTAVRPTSRPRRHNHVPSSLSLLQAATEGTTQLCPPPTPPPLPRPPPGYRGVGRP
jgi:hypothetical protein